MDDAAGRDKWKRRLWGAPVVAIVIGGSLAGCDGHKQPPLHGSAPYTGVPTSAPVAGAVGSHYSPPTGP